MKKTLSIVISLLLCFLITVPAFAETDKKNSLKFDSNGEFRIMQINDTQDKFLKDVKQINFLKKVVAEEKPDLVVFAGDQITDFFPGATKEGLKKCVDNFFPVFNELGVPFVITYGNHDHDWDDKGLFTLEEQMEYYKSFSNCYVPDDGFGLGTYNLPILSSDGKSIAFNVYVFDSNNKAPEGLITGYEGLHADQVQWYKDTRDALKKATGNYVNSLVFQHVPVKEIYQFVDEVPVTEDLTGAIFDLDGNKWYKLNDKATGTLGEAPCSEVVTGNTGEYEAFVEKGDVIGAFFGHDHVNNFLGKTSDGITLGYNGGTGFSTYGLGGNRSVRMFVINEKDTSTFSTYLRTYNDVMGTSLKFFPTDIISMVSITVVVKFFVNLCPDFLMEIFGLFMSPAK